MVPILQPFELHILPLQPTDLEQVSVHYLQAAGGAHRRPRQGSNRRDRRRRREGGRRVAILIEKIFRPRGTLTEDSVTAAYNILFHKKNILQNVGTDVPSTKTKQVTEFYNAENKNGAQARPSC